MFSRNEETIQKGLEGYHPWLIIKEKKYWINGTYNVLLQIRKKVNR